MFRIQSEIFRNFHMLDPQAFYNKEDVWDIALHAAGQNAGTAPMEPSYVMANLPGRDAARVHADDPVHAAQQEQSHWDHGRPGVMGEHLGSNCRCCCYRNNISSQDR